MEDTDDTLWQKLISPYAEQLIERYKEVNHLVHYTSFATLKSMIDNEQLWFSSASTMNDLNELRHGKNIILQEAAKTDSNLQKIFRTLKEKHAALFSHVDVIFNRQFKRDPYDSFISCWSNCDPANYDHDDLTMWRGYAADGNGVAIVIDPKVIQLGTMRLSEIVFWPVHYETDLEFIDRCEQTFANFLDIIKNLSPEEIAVTPVTFAEAFNEILYYLAVTHKHVAFRTEREWRFVWRRERASNKYLDYLKPQSSREALYEFFCLPLEDDPELANGSLNIRHIISEIMIGPTSDSFHKLRAVENMLMRKGFDKSTRITGSTIPYRSSRY